MEFDGAGLSVRVTLLLFGLAWAPLAMAQTPHQAPRPGQRLRITAPTFQADQAVGRLVRLDQDSLVLDRAGRFWAVPRALVARAETFNGTRGRALRGAFIGGLAAGAFVGQDIIRHPCEGSGNYGQLCALALVGGTLAGAGVGALIGAAVRRDDWIEVSLDVSGPDSGRPGHTAGPAAPEWRRPRGPDATGPYGPANWRRFSLTVALPVR